MPLPLPVPVPLPVPLSRRQLLVQAAATALLALAPAQRLAAAEAPDQLWDLRSGRATSREAVLAEMASADVVLLGEWHDNPWHHQRRAALLQALQVAMPGLAVVAEHLPQGGRLARGDAPLLQRLEAAGFDARGWAWPLHQPLFQAIDDAGLPLRGGNLPRDEARRIAREGEAAVPAALHPLLRAAPLGDAAQAALDAELVAGHCGQLGAARLPAMRLAQRSRDAALWLALATSGGRPAVLLAGNGHVRLDVGVPQLARATSAGLRLISVGFGEVGDALEGPYTHLWLTPKAPREPACPEAPTAAPGAPAAARPAPGASRAS